VFYFYFLYFLNIYNKIIFIFIESEETANTKHEHCGVKRKIYNTENANEIKKLEDEIN